MNRREKSTPWFELAAARTKAQFTGASEHAATTERRVIEAVTRRKRKPSALWLVPLTLIGSGSLAWAEEVQLAVAWTVDQVQELVNAVSPRSEPETITSIPPSVLPKADVSARTPLAITATPAEAPAASAAGEETDSTPIEFKTGSPAILPPSAPSGSRQGQVHVGSEVHRALGTAASNSTPTPNGNAASNSNAVAEPTDLERYRAGFTAQYERRDYAAALAAWDDYLRHVPGGRFTPEVRYHRALSLVQLGRREQAIAALQPFAAGAYGPLHQRSATKLIAELSASPNVGITGR